MSTACALDTCKQEVTDATLFVTKRGIYHSMYCAAVGLALPRRTRTKKGMSAAWRGRRKKWLAENKGVNFNPEEKRQPAPIIHMPIQTETTEVTHPWAKIKYDGENYIAAEATVLIKTTPDSPLRLMFSDMRNVRMYMDDQGGLLIRPVQEGTATRHIAGGGAIEAVAGSTEATKRRRVLPITLGGKYGRNPATPGSKRFYLVESMLEGGTVRDIFARAAKSWSKSTGKSTEEFGMISTPSNARDMFVWLKEKLEESTGKKVVVKEEGDTFHIE